MMKWPIRRTGKNKNLPKPAMNPALNIIGMISPEERSFFFQWAKDSYTGQGEIADLGCWLGATTAALASGLFENYKVKTKKERIFAYDNFRWDVSMDRFVVNTEFENKFRQGELCLSAFVKNIEPYSDCVEVCPGDLCNIGWKSRPLEFLLIDAMKSWRTANGVIKHFFPSLIPGVSIVAHQDFAHYYTSWVHLLQYRFRDYFEPLYGIHSSGTMVYRYKQNIPETMLNHTYSFSDFSETEIDDAFSYSLQICDPSAFPAVHAAHIMAYVHLGMKGKAMRLLKNAGNSGADIDHSEMKDAIKMLQAMGDPVRPATPHDHE